MTDTIKPVAWLDSRGFPHHISAVQSAAAQRLHGPWKPLYACPSSVPIRALREVMRISDRDHAAWSEVKAWLDKEPT